MLINMGFPMFYKVFPYKVRSDFIFMYMKLYKKSILFVTYYESYI